MIFEIDDAYIKKLVDEYNKNNKNLFNIKGDDNQTHPINSGDTLKVSGDDNIKTEVKGKTINIKLNGDLVNIKTIKSPNGNANRNCC